MSLLIIDHSYSAGHCDAEGEMGAMEPEGWELGFVIPVVKSRVMDGYRRD